VLEFYVDDRSETASYLLAGLIAPARTWVRFGRAWSAVLARSPALPYWDQDAALAGRPPFDGLSRTQLKRRCVALARMIADFDLLPVAVTMTAGDFDQHVRGGLLIPQQTDPELAERRLRALRLGQQPARTLHLGLVPFAERAVQRHGRPQGVRLVLDGAQPARKGEIELLQVLRAFVAHRAARPEAPPPAAGGRELLASIEHAPARGAGPASRALEAAALVGWAARSVLDGRGRNRVAGHLGPIEIVSAGVELAKEWTDAVNASWANGLASQARV